MKTQEELKELQEQYDRALELITLYRYSLFYVRAKKRLWAWMLPVTEEYNQQLYKLQANLPGTQEVLKDYVQPTLRAVKDIDFSEFLEDVEEQEKEEMEHNEDYFIKNVPEFCEIIVPRDCLTNEERQGPAFPDYIVPIVDDPLEFTAMAVELDIPNK